MAHTDNQAHTRTHRERTHKGQHQQTHKGNNNTHASNKETQQRPPVHSMSNTSLTQARRARRTGAHAREPLSLIHI
eukprot:13024202-Alexandrium_andersonii.AAC.1